MAGLPGGDSSGQFDLGDFGTVGAALSELAGRTRGNVENHFRSQIQGSSPWAEASAKFFEGLDAALGLAAGLAKAITEAFTNVILAGVETLQDILDAAATLFGLKWDAITANSEAIASLNEIAAAMNTTQLYVGDLEDMVTAPRSQLVTSGLASTKSTNILNGFTIVLGATLKPNMPVFKPDTPLGSSSGKVYYTPVVVNRKGTPGKMRWIAGSDSSIFSIDYYEMALCAYNPTNGNIEKVWGSGDVKDSVPSTTTLKEVEINMGLTSQHVTPGQILFVAHQQVAPGVFQESRTFAAVPQGNVGRPAAALLDGACFVTSSYYTAGIPSSIALSSLDRENRFIPWAAITVDVE